MLAQLALFRRDFARAALFVRPAIEHTTKFRSREML